ncbi:MAG: hypothetical protein RML15_09030 [Bacteroidota bacterium]|nr:hypothetical protein [Candidatus Kapabacteria bacterium]MCS7303419.1 hypothetical protein [Candidatus Kapabacteria bacterium]MDW8075880.1 hypothetical protein [Bacteroidota bacterium]MDW8272534.1 hypothetical protein [Bacteroidota bacterium]
MTDEELRRYFGEHLYWTLHPQHQSHSLPAGIASAQLVPLARAGQIVAFAVRCPAELPPPLRRAVAAKARELTPNPLLLFFEDRSIVWHFDGMEQRTSLPLATADDSFLRAMQLPLDRELSSSAIEQQVRTAFVPPSRTQPMSSVHPLEEAIEQLAAALSRTIEDAATIAAKAFKRQLSMPFDAVTTLQAALGDLERKINTIRQEVTHLLDEYPILREQSKPMLPPKTVHPKKPLRKEHTPQRAFRCAILQALLELGGSAKMNQAIDRVYLLMKDKLKPGDFVHTLSGREKWWSNVQGEKNTMKIEGLLRSDSPWGIWEISDEGRRYYEQHCKNNQ